MRLCLYGLRYSWACSLWQIQKCLLQHYWIHVVPLSDIKGGALLQWRPVCRLLQPTVTVYCKENSKDSHLCLRDVFHKTSNIPIMCLRAWVCRSLGIYGDSLIFKQDPTWEYPWVFMCSSVNCAYSKVWYDIWTTNMSVYKNISIKLQIVHVLSLNDTWWRNHCAWIEQLDPAMRQRLCDSSWCTSGFKLTASKIIDLRRWSFNSDYLCNLRYVLTSVRGETSTQCMHSIYPMLVQCSNIKWRDSFPLDHAPWFTL